MSDEVTPTPQPTPTPTPPPAATWFDGMEGLDDTMKGHIQNRGWDKLEPAKAAQEAYKAFRAAEQHIGTPADRLIRLPADLADQAGWDGVYRKLGVPESADLYDLSAIKRADGSAVPEELAKAIKAAAHEGKVSKDYAAAIAKGIIGHLDTEAANQRTAAETALAAEKQKLADSWGAQFAQNLEVAKRAAQRFGLKPEIVDAIQQGSSYSETMEFLRQVGSTTMEMSFPGGQGPGPGSVPMTKEGAKAQMDANMKDPEWRSKYLAGSAQHRAEFDRLTKILAGLPVT